jgi:hypothetical protein
MSFSWHYRASSVEIGSEASAITILASHTHHRLSNMSKTCATLIERGIYLARPLQEKSIVERAGVLRRFG